MIYRFYDVYCDYCGRLIHTYADREPNNEDLKMDVSVVTSKRQFCSERCYDDWNHDRQSKQYSNLRQNGRIHNK